MGIGGVSIHIYIYMKVGVRSLGRLVAKILLDAVNFIKVFRKIVYINSTGARLSST